MLFATFFSFIFNLTDEKLGGFLGVIVAIFLEHLLIGGHKSGKLVIVFTDVVVTT